jgi:hypothetical protein
MKQRLLIAYIVLIALARTGFKNANESAIPITSDAIPPILLFNGTGASPNDVAAVEKILNEQNLNYWTVKSSHMNDMSGLRLRGYRLLIIPGGNYIAIGDGLLPSTTEKNRDPIQNGLNYLGICAGDCSRLVLTPTV